MKSNAYENSAFNRHSSTIVMIYYMWLLKNRTDVIKFFIETIIHGQYYHLQCSLLPSIPTSLHTIFSTVGSNAVGPFPTGSSWAPPIFALPPFSDLKQASFKYDGCAIAEILLFAEKCFTDWAVWGNALSRWRIDRPFFSKSWPLLLPSQNWQIICLINCLD